MVSFLPEEGMGDADVVLLSPGDLRIVDLGSGKSLIFVEFNVLSLDFFFMPAGTVDDLADGSP